MWFEKLSQKLAENITEHTTQRDNRTCGSHQGDKSQYKIQVK